MTLPTSDNSQSELLGAACQASSIRLLDADPDLVGFLSAEEQRAVDPVALPVKTVTDNDVDVNALIADAKAFGALVVDGMLVHRVRIGDHPALRLLGPRDVFCLGAETSTTLLAESRCDAIAATRLALLGNSILIVAHRFPRIVRDLLARLAEQSEREAAHLAISQLPRVDERLMAIMWLLAEKWGYVTRSGTVVPLALTHETLGGLIGARRPTVTLALGELSERGRLIKQDEGWLIIEPPPRANGSIRALGAPELLEPSVSRSPDGEQLRRNATNSYAGLREQAAAVHEENKLGRERASEQLLRLKLRRNRCGRLRQRARERRARRREPNVARS